MARKLRIFLADDHAVVRDGLKMLINAESDMEVVGEATNGRETIERILSATLPDVAVLDFSMPEINGAQATQRLRQDHPNLKVVALTVHEDRGYLRELLGAGASGYVLKRAAGDELIRAVRAVAVGEIYIDPRVTSNLVKIFVTPEAGGPAAVDELSDRETDAMRLIAQGYTNKEVGTELGVSVKTVETYKKRSMEKLGLRSRVDIVRIAAERGWLQGR